MKKFEVVLKNNAIDPNCWIQWNTTERMKLYMLTRTISNTEHFNKLNKIITRIDLKLLKLQSKTNVSIKQLTKINQAVVDLESQIMWATLS